MSGEHNLTPEQRAIPPQARKRAYERIPMTCEKLRGILDQVKAKIMESFDIPPEEDADIDATISWAFLQIRDEITQPFRTEQMKLVWERMQLLFAVPYARASVTVEAYSDHPFEGDLYETLATEFGSTRIDVKNHLFIVLYGIQTDRKPGEDMLAYCRRKLIEMGWKPCQPNLPTASPTGSADALKSNPPAPST